MKRGGKILINTWLRVKELLHEREALSAWAFAAALLGVALFLLVFQDMHRLGNRMERRARVDIRTER